VIGRLRIPFQITRDRISVQQQMRRLMRRGGAIVPAFDLGCAGAVPGRGPGS
jgi:hypothetical protein